MACQIEVLFTPAEFRKLRERDLTRTTCVVFDILRATSTFVTALAAGAKGILPVSEISEALAWRQRDPTVLLAGERDGLRIGGTLTGGVEFDLGNSPREFVNHVVADRIVVATTTNGTRALRACAGAEEVCIGSFLNQTATLQHLKKRPRERICLVGAGTGEAAALEDILAAGSLCDQLTVSLASVELEDSAQIALGTFRAARGILAETLCQARNARRLLSMPELRDDVQFCIQLDAFDFTAASDADGLLRRLP